MIKSSLPRRPLQIALAIFALAISTSVAQAQNLTLEGQTGGFITPTAYVVQSNKGQVFSHPSLGFHYVHAGDVIGDVYTGSVTEGIANWVEFGYTRSAHTNGDNPYFSALWEYSGMNIFHGKSMVLPENAFGTKWVPGVAAGFIVRTGDHFVTGAIDEIYYAVLRLPRAACAA